MLKQENRLFQKVKYKVNKLSVIQKQNSNMPLVYALLQTDQQTNQHLKHSCALLTQGFTFVLKTGCPVG